MESSWSSSSRMRGALFEISDYAYVFDTGLNRYEGTGVELANDERVEELYLGGARFVERD